MDSSKISLSSTAGKAPEPGSPGARDDEPETFDIKVSNIGPREKPTGTPRGKPTSSPSETPSYDPTGDPSSNPSGNPSDTPNKSEDSGDTVPPDISSCEADVPTTTVTTATDPQIGITDKDDKDPST